MTGSVGGGASGARRVCPCTCGSQFLAHFEMTGGARQQQGRRVLLEAETRDGVITVR